MWGFSLEFWESVFLWATGIAAVAGGVSVLSAFVAGIIGYRTSDVVQKDMAVKLAEANARAAEAHLALEKYKAPRSLDAPEVQLLVSQLRPFSGQKYQITTFWDVQEPLAFSNQLHNALQQSGWKFIPHGEGGSFLLGVLSGVQVWVHPKAQPSVLKAADALVSALAAAGASPTLKQQDAATPNDSIIRLNVGTKH